MAKKAAAIASMVVHIGLDKTEVTQGLTAMKNSVRAATAEWKTQFSIFNQLGDRVSAAEAKYKGLTTAVEAQTRVVEKQRSQLQVMGKRTSENADAYDKLSAQINQNANKLAGLTAQQQKARKMYDYEASGIRQNKQELSLLEREMQATVAMYKAQGDEQKAAAEQADGLRKQLSLLNSMRDKEQQVLEKVKQESGENSDAYREQALRLTNLRTRISSVSAELNDMEGSARKPLLSLTRLREGIGKTRDAAHETTGVFKSMLGASLVSGAIFAGLASLKNHISEVAHAGAEYNKQQQVMNATWETLTGSAKKGKAMVNSVNQMSVAFGQSADVVHELDQQFYHVFNNQPKTEKLTKSMLTLADTLGMSNADVQRLGLNFTHMLSSGMLQLEDFNNITDQLPMYGEKLLDYERKVQHNSNLTMAQLRKEMSAGKISAQDATVVIEDLGKKYARASENMMSTLPGMERVISARVPALIGAFEKPFQRAQSSLFSGVSKWVSSTHTEKLFNQMGDAASRGMTTIMDAFGKVFGAKGATSAADAAVKGLTKGITRFSNYIADHAGDIVKFFNKAKEQAGAFATTFADTFKKVGPAVAETAKTLNKVLKPILNLIAEHPKQFAELATGMLLANKAMSLLNPALSIAGKGFSATSKSIAYMRNESTLGHKAVTGLGKGIKGIGKWSGKAIISSIKGVGTAAKTSAKWVGSLSKSFLTKAKAAAIAAGQKIITGATKAWTIAQKALNLALKANPIGLIITAVGLLVTGFVALYKHNKKFRDFVDSIGRIIKKFFGGLGKWFKGIWNGITDGVKKFVGGVKDKFNDMKKGVSDHAKKMADAAKDKFNDMKKWSVDATKKMADQVMDKHSWLNKHTNGAASTMFSGLKKTYKSGHKTMESATDTFRDLVHGKWSKLGGDIKRTTKSAMNTARDYFHTGYNTLNKLTGGRLGDLVDSVKSHASSMASTFKKLPGRMASGIRNGWGAIVDAARHLGNGLIKGIAGGVNGAIGGIDWILGKVHAPKIPKWKPKYFAAGGDALGLSVVGEKGKHELIKHADGRIEMSPNKATLYNFKQPVKILGGDKTEQLLKTLGVPQFGLGTWLGEAIDFVKGGFSKIASGAEGFWSAITNPKKLLNTAIANFTDLSGLSGTVKDMAEGAVKTVASNALNWIKSKLELAGNPPGSGAERWKPYVIRALGMNGLPTSESYVNAWLRQIASESGGNPRAVQHGYTDVNTLSGDLAKGLLQTISATFKANKFAGHGDIFNGFDNMLAAIHYAKNRYGKSGMLKVIGHGHGYADGGFVATEQIARLAEGNKPEVVVPLTNRNRFLTMMYKALDYFSEHNGGTGSNTAGGGSDLQAVVERQDAQLTLMQKQIDLLTKLLFKDFSIDPNDFESGISKKQAKRYKNQNYMAGTVVTS